METSPGSPSSARAADDSISSFLPELTEVVALARSVMEEATVDQYQELRLVFNDLYETLSFHRQLQKSSGERLPGL